MDIDQLDLDAISMNQSQTFDFVWFPKAGIKINNQGMKTLSDGTIIQAVAESITPQQIQIGDIIGQGVASHVCRGIYIPYNCLIAIKIVNVFDKDKRHQMVNDLKTFLTGYDCRQLITFLGAYYEEGMIKIILEYMNQGSLRCVIKRIHAHNLQHTITEDLLATLSHEILTGLHYLHRVKHQLHRDIKPENILLDSSGQLKLTDFGISKQLETTYAMTNTFVGTSVYMSPERMNSKGYSYAADVWALGIILVEMASGRHPYLREKQTYIELIQTIRQSPSPTLNQGEPWTNEFRDFLALCLDKDDVKRGDAQSLLKHPWIQQHAKDQSYLSEWLLNLNQLTSKT